MAFEGIGRGRIAALLWVIACGLPLARPDGLGAQQVSLVAYPVATASPYSATIGTRRVFICRPNLPLQTVWGTDVYTDDTPICSAAVHAGVITHAEGGVVTIVISEGQQNYPASTRNGIQSIAWNRPHERSYTFDRTTPARGQIDWGTTAAGLPREFSAPLEVTCPATTATAAAAATIYGTDVYTDDSAICPAALHAGLITLGGGAVPFVSRGAQKSFASTTRNGVTSHTYGPWEASFGFGGTASATSADLTSVTSTSTVPTPTQVVGSPSPGTAVAPTTTSVKTPTSPGVTAGPLPAGTVTSPSPATATAVSSPTNPLRSTSGGTTETQLSAASVYRPPPPPSPSDKTVIGITTPTAPGPATLSANAFAPSEGWGVVLTWPALSGVTTYWVSRKITGTTDPARYTDVLFITRDASTIVAVDPFVYPGTRYTYWVVGYTPGSGETKPSPIAAVATFTPPSAPELVQVASVSAPSMLTMPGPLAASSPMLGSSVKWAWRRDRSGVFLYQISYEILGGVAGIGPVFVREALPATDPAAQMISFTLGVPQGKTVRFCVHTYATTDKTAPLPPGATCVDQIVP